MGHLLHSFILVPYHGWRLSHKKHHGNHGHIDNDESWHPLTESQWEQLVSTNSVAVIFFYCDTAGILLLLLLLLQSLLLYMAVAAFGASVSVHKLMPLLPQAQAPTLASILTFC